MRKRINMLPRGGKVIGLLAIVSLIVLPAFARTPKPKRPIVAIIRAEWCSACQKLEPTIMELKNQYGDRMDFVILDVSDEQRTAESANLARKLGLNRFFEANKQKTSTVIVFSTSRRIVFKTMQNFDRGAYVKAFEDALARA